MSKNIFRLFSLVLIFATIVNASHGPSDSSFTVDKSPLLRGQRSLLIHDQQADMVADMQGEEQTDSKEQSKTENKQEEGDEEFYDSSGYFDSEFIKTHRKTPSIDVKLAHLKGFKFCPQLNNGAFDLNAKLDSYKIVEIIKMSKTEIPSDLKSTLFSYARKSNRYKIKRFFKKLWGTIRTFKSQFKKKSSEKPKDFKIPEIPLEKLVVIYPMIVDTIAESIFVRDISRYKVRHIFNRHSFKPVDLENAKNFACYMAADGYNDWVKISRSQVMQFIDGSRYFQGRIEFDRLDLKLGKFELDASALGPNVDVKAFEYSRDELVYFPKSPPHKLAFFLLVHDGLDNIKKLMERLYDPWVVIAIHVDAKNPALKMNLYHHLQRERYDTARVFIVDESFSGTWGHSSLVFAQMAGMFELLKFNSEWEYVINLSAYDYPLVSNMELYHMLKLNGETNWIDHNEGHEGEMPWRMTHKPVFRAHSPQGPSNAGKGIFESMRNSRVYDDKEKKHSSIHKMFKSSDPNKRTLKIFRDKWNLLKHSQWMMLHRSFIEMLKRSPTAGTFLAYSDFAFIPDEFYYATLATNLVTGYPETGEYFETKVINDNRRFLEFRGVSPRPITLNDFEMLKKKVTKDGIVMARKIDISKEKELVRRLDYEAETGWAPKKIKYSSDAFDAETGVLDSDLETQESVTG